MSRSVRRLREASIVLDNSDVGGKSSNGVEKAAEALGEQIRFTKAALESRSGILVKRSHILTRCGWPSTQPTCRRIHCRF